jgi:hypothetical protein
VALVVAFILTGWGARWHERLLGPIWEGERVLADARRRIRASTIFEMTCFGIILACMVLMGIGL